MLWLNSADPLCPGGRGFVNAAQQAGVHDGGWGWGGKFADFNNDGLLDIYTVNGFVTGSPKRNYWFAIQEMVTQTKNQTIDAADWPAMADRDLSGHEHGRLFMQAPRAGGTSTSVPRFVECAQAAGITDRFNGRGIAVADYDQDGYLDMFVANQGAESCYYVNQTGRKRSWNGDPAQAFLRMTLVGLPDAGIAFGNRVFASTTGAVGARVTVTTEHGDQIREVQGGMGFASQSEYALHFGFPSGASIRHIKIRWPSGLVQEFDGEAARAMVNRHVRIVERGTGVTGL
jgi:hypothetical protein